MRPHCKVLGTGHDVDAPQRCVDVAEEVFFRCHAPAICEQISHADRGHSRRRARRYG